MCLLHLKCLHKKGLISSIPSVGNTKYQFGQTVTEVNSVSMTCEAEQTEYFDVCSMHVPRQVLTLHLGPRGTPFKVFIDSGAARTMGKLTKLEEAGLTLEELNQPLYMRLADDKIAANAIKECVRSCSVSALNGEMVATAGRPGFDSHCLQSQIGVDSLDTTER
eukprot:COSAG02_NODE_2_length_75708_cov_87.013953_2_plen_164_part_00